MGFSPGLRQLSLRELLARSSLHRAQPCQGLPLTRRARCYPKRPTANDFCWLEHRERVDASAACRAAAVLIGDRDQTTRAATSAQGSCLARRAFQHSADYAAATAANSRAAGARRIEPR